LPNETLPQRTMKTTFLLAAFFALIFTMRGELTIAIGLSIGTGVALFSLWSLIVAVPRLLRAGGGPAAKAMLGFAALLKLPVYAITLHFAMTSRWVEPFAVFAGAALVPVVLVLKVVGWQLLAGVSNPLGEEACPSNSGASN
jgi:hypothetical protein